MKRQDVIEMLTKGAVTVHFTKADGSPRIMNCTLDENMFRYEYKERTSEKKTKNITQSVWDIDAGGWRSFKWDSVRQVNYTKTPHGIRE